MEKQITKVELSGFDSSLMTFSAARDNGISGRSSQVYYSKKKLYLELPRMRVPFGVSIFEKEEKSDYVLNVSFGKCGDTENNEEIMRAMGIIKEIEGKVIEKAIGSGWVDPSKQMFKSTVIESNKGYPSTLKLKLTKSKEDVFTCNLFNNKKEGIDLELEEIKEVLCKRSELKSIIECSGFYSTSTKYGISWKLYQGVVFAPVSNDITECAFD